MSGFWKFTNSYASNVSKILEKDEFTLEELLDEQETVSELLASNAKLVEYFRQPDVLTKLVDYVVEDDVYEKQEILEREAEEERENETDKEDQTEVTNKENDTHDRLRERRNTTSVQDDYNSLSDSDSDNSDNSDNSDSDEDDIALLNRLDSDGLYNDDDDVGDLSFDDEQLAEAKDDEEERKKRETPAERHTRRAQVAAEILSVDVWSLTDTFMEHTALVRKLWTILDKEAPLPIFSATYFMKINEHLLDMKTPEMIQFILDEPNSMVARFMRHIDTPPLMDFLLKVISTDKPDSPNGVIDLLKQQDLIPELLAQLDSSVSSSAQSSAADFLKAFITISANSAESTTIGPNELTRQLVSQPMVCLLLKMMLQGGTALSNGVGIVIEIIRKNNSDYDPVPVVYVTPETHPPNPRDPIYLGTLVREFAAALPQFTALLDKTIEQKLPTPFGEIEPLGFERFKICELVAELIHCSNMGLLNDDKGEEIVNERDLIRQKLIERHQALMREADADSTVSWDDMDLTREIDNLRLSSSSPSPPSPMSDEAAEKAETSIDTANLFDEKLSADKENDETDEQEQEPEEDQEQEPLEQLIRRDPVPGDQLKIALYDTQTIVKILGLFCRFPWNNFLHNVVFDIVQQILSASLDTGFNVFLVVDLFDRGHITQMIIDGYEQCVEHEEETGIHLGYMGHLTLIAEEVVKFVSLRIDGLAQFRIIKESVENPEWKQFVDEVLVDTRNKYNAVLGNESGIDDLDETDDLNFGDGSDEYEGAERGDNGDDDSDSGSGNDNSSDEDDEEEGDLAHLENRDRFFDYDQGNTGSAEDPFSRYMSKEMTVGFHDRMSDDDSEEEEATAVVRTHRKQSSLAEKPWKFDGDRMGGEDSRLNNSPFQLDVIKEDETLGQRLDGENVGAEVVIKVKTEVVEGDEKDEQVDGDGTVKSNGNREEDERKEDKKPQNPEEPSKPAEPPNSTKPAKGSAPRDESPQPDTSPTAKVPIDNTKNIDADEVAIDAGGSLLGSDGEEYEDPNDDGQSYTKANHPLYQADGSLNYPIHTSTLHMQIPSVKDVDGV